MTTEKKQNRKDKPKSAVPRTNTEKMDKKVADAAIDKQVAEASTAKEPSQTDRIVQPAADKVYKTPKKNKSAQSSSDGCDTPSTVDSSGKKSKQNQRNAKKTRSKFYNPPGKLLRMSTKKRTKKDLRRTEQHFRILKDKYKTE